MADAIEVYRDHPTEEEIDSVLAKRTSAAVGTLNPDGSVHLSYVIFLHDQGQIWFETSSVTRKARNLSRDGRVSILVQGTAATGRHLMTSIEGVGPLADRGRGGGGEAPPARQVHQARGARRPRPGMGPVRRRGRRGLPHPQAVMDGVGAARRDATGAGGRLRRRLARGLTDPDAVSSLPSAAVTRPQPTPEDSAVPLRDFRQRFAFPDPDLVYLDGNSLGRLPIAAVDRAGAVVVGEWGDRLIRSWNEGWWELPFRIGDAIAPIIGAGPGEVAVADSTSVNLFKLAVAALDRHRRTACDSHRRPQLPLGLVCAGGRRPSRRRRPPGGGHRVIGWDPRPGRRHRRPARRRRRPGQPVGGHLRQRLPLRPGGDHRPPPTKPERWCCGT